MALTIKTLMEKMPGAFRPDKAPGLDAVIQFHFTGEQASDWYAVADYVGIFTGEVDGMAAFMQGKLKLAGDLNLAVILTWR